MADCLIDLCDDMFFVGVQLIFCVKAPDEIGDCKEPVGVGQHQ